MSSIEDIIKRRKQELFSSTKKVSLPQNNDDKVVMRRSKQVSQSERIKIRKQELLSNTKKKSTSPVVKADVSSLKRSTTITQSEKMKIKRCKGSI